MTVSICLLMRMTLMFVIDFILLQQFVFLSLSNHLHLDGEVFSTTYE